MEERSTPAVPVPPSTQVTPAGAAGDDDPVESVPVREAPAEPEEFEKPEGHPPLWRNRDYMLLWSGQVIIAVVWLWALLYPLYVVMPHFLL